MGFYEFKRAAAKCDTMAKKRDAVLRKQRYEKNAAKERKERAKADSAARKSPYLEIPDEMTLTETYVDGVDNNRRFNEEYSEYFERLGNETNDRTLLNIAGRVANCHKYWFGDWYGMQRVFDVKNVQLCHNRFCVNCLHLLQASRLKRFTPIFEKLSELYDIYMLTLTTPNVTGELLGDTLDCMSYAFTKLISYFKGKAVIKGVDFKQYGYVGGLRNFEIVTNLDDYHAHIHSLLVLKKDLPLYKELINCYSYDDGILTRKFSDLEVLIQKIWYLLCNGKTVRLNTLNTVPVGYSCVMDKIDGNGWHEAFKYVTKLTVNGMPYLYYEQFKTLFYALYRRKIMQGYGCLRKVSDDDSIDDSAIEEYAKICAQLRLVEDPASDFTYDLDDLLYDVRNKHIRVISKRSVQKYLNEIAEDEK